MKHEPKEQSYSVEVLHTTEGSSPLIRACSIMAAALTKGNAWPDDVHSEAATACAWCEHRQDTSEMSIWRQAIGPKAMQLCRPAGKMHILSYGR